MIERYPFHERICHWLTGFAYLYCLATGLAFYSPYLFWLAVMLGDEAFEGRLRAKRIAAWRIRHKMGGNGLLLRARCRLCYPT